MFLRYPLKARPCARAHGRLHQHGIQLSSKCARAGANPLLPISRQGRSMLAVRNTCAASKPLSLTSKCSAARAFPSISESHAFNQLFDEPAGRRSGACFAGRCRSTAIASLFELGDRAQFRSRTARRQAHRLRVTVKRFETRPSRTSIFRRRTRSRQRPPDTCRA